MCSSLQDSSPLPGTREAGLSRVSGCCGFYGTRFGNAETPTSRRSSTCMACLRTFPDGPRQHGTRTPSIRPSRSKRSSMRQSSMSPNVAPTGFCPTFSPMSSRHCCSPIPGSSRMLSRRGEHTWVNWRKLGSRSKAPSTSTTASTPHPSARLRSLLRPRYSKVRHGRAVSARIGVDRMRAECVHFDGWMARVEALPPLRPEI